MAISLHTVSGGTVSAEDDARLYAKLTNGAGGIVEGGVCTITSGLEIHVTAGWGIACGRIFSWDADNITVAGSGTGTKQGRLKIVIDLTDLDDPIGIESEVATTLPSLTQQDLNSSGTVYEIALATYEVTTTAASSIVSNTPVSINPASSSNAIMQTADIKAVSYVNSLPVSPDANTLYIIPE